MSFLPIELWSLIAADSIQVYSALVTVIKGLSTRRSWEDYFTAVDVDDSGITTWSLRGKTHRGGDLPASIHKDGCQVWYKYGKIHRDGDKPAVVYPNGDSIWYRYGERHRDNDQPASISTLHCSWYQHGVLHRDNDQPAIVYANGNCSWYQHGQLHRDFDGRKMWYCKGIRYNV